MKISVTTARRLAIRCQGVDGRWRLPRGKEGTAQAVERLGYVQIDTISVVQRAHHHTLWSRCPDYTPEMLHELQARDRRVFEYWTHAASYVPMCDYRYYLPRMRTFAQRGRQQQWIEKNGRLMRDVQERIRKEGALGASDFADTRAGKRGPWWDWKPAKGALEMLFSMGELMVAERRGFQRIYDLAERVLPEGTDMSEPDPDEMACFTVRRALGLHGVASPGEIAWRRRNAKEVSGAIGALVDSGEVTPVRVKGLYEEDAYALTEAVQAASRQRRGRARVHILSPFDSLVIRRPRLKALFGFDYTLECYVPAAKRRYGYFCLPILWGEQFVGRLDAKADRKGKALLLRRLMFEADFGDYEGLLPALAEKLRAFADFNGCERIVVEETEPGKVRAALRRELALTPRPPLPQAEVGEFRAKLLPGCPGN